jgi:YcdB, YcdC repeated domain
VNKDPKDTDITYLPQRYKMQIEAKKRRRLYKKIGVFFLIIIICAIVYVVANGMVTDTLTRTGIQLPSIAVPTEIIPLPQSVEPASTSAGNITVVITPNYIIGDGVPVRPESGMQSLDAAIASLRLDYPEDVYTLISVNVNDKDADQKLFEFRIRQSNSSADDTGFSVFINAETADPYTLGQDNVRITADQAETLLSNHFIADHPEKIRLRYVNITDSLQEWIFTLYQGNTTILRGTMDPDTGQVTSFSRSIEQSGRPADPLLDSSAAQNIADRFIVEQNGFPLAVNMSKSRYEPLGSPDQVIAGQYVFVYNRIVQDIPCDYEGFTIAVDSVTGEVTDYQRRWTAPDNAFSLVSEPLITHSEATYAVLERAKQTYPAASDGLKIISADRRWKDQTPSGSVPRPGSIPIAWKVQFDDTIIRQKPWLLPGVGWVDDQSGKILDFYYLH